MKLPWDKNYLKISFHVVFTLFVIYILTLLVSNIVPIFQFILDIVGKILSLLSPLIIGAVTAYLLDPIVDFFQHKYEKIYKKKKHTGKRAIGTAITYLSLAVLITLLVFIIFSGFDKVNDFDVIDIIASSVSNINDLLVSLQVKLAEVGMLENLEMYIKQAISQLTSFIQNFGVTTINSLTKAGGSVSNFFIGIVIAFYFLLDKKKIKDIWNRILDTFLPESTNKKTHEVFEDINIIFSGYIRGQITDALIMAALISVSLSVIGVKFPIIIGVISGFSNLIPYFGAIIGFVLAVVVSLLSGEPMRALYAAIVIIILQQIDGIFIVPKVVGEKVELHPAIVLIALSIAGGLFGILGMVLAVPVVATIKLFLIRYYKRIERNKNIEKR